MTCGYHRDYSKTNTQEILMNKQTIKTGIWSAIAGAVLTMIIGFGFGGWVLGSTSVEKGEQMSRNAVIERLVPICIGQYKLDPDREKKLSELKDMSSWKREQYVKDQGWAQMPFETESDSRVADKCSMVILESS